MFDVADQGLARNRLSRAAARAPSGGGEGAKRQAWGSNSLDDASGALPHASGRYTVSQGREVGHDARLELRVDANGDVWSGGQVQTVVRGELDWR